MKRYIQNKDVDWLDTPKGTIWIPTDVSNLSNMAKVQKIPFLTPADEKLRTTPAGVRLDKHRDLFTEMK